VKVRVAYLTTEYPKVSHTFIRRELIALEELGHEVARLSIRPCATFVDEADRAESQKTFVCLERPAWRILLDAAIVAVQRPVRFLNAASTAFSMGRVSDRGLARHLVYLLEAAVLLRHLTSNRVQHVHVHFGTNAAAVALLVKRLGGPPYSLTIHGPDEFDAPIGGSLSRKVAESRFTVAITSYCLSQIRRWVHLTHWGKLHIVRCTVGSDFFTANEPIDPASRTLVCVGRLSAQKGQIVLLEAFALMVQRGIDGFLTIVGDGELRELLEETIRSRGLESRVRITGWADESTVRAHISSARALVLPSFAEGLPVVIMEALALARPVITTWIAGIPELLAHGENGWLIAPSDVAALSAAMQDALEMPVDRLNEMGTAGRARVLAAHSTIIEAQKLSALLVGQNS
jgi:colanic acid/amylovoran biosynthesis glycosyltransferase